MNNPLLATKLHPPILRKDLVARLRLIERLNEGLWQGDGFVRKLTLLSAPAGFGKTTLVSEWLRESNFQAAWLSLDESDNDPARFLAYILAALRRVQPEFGSATSAILQLPQPPPPQVILTSLVNEISKIPAPFILALDDYHSIHTPPIHHQITFILDHSPANMHLVVLTREDPLLPVTRLRARAQLLEIRQDDLRFTYLETAEFLQRSTGLRLGANEIAALERHTEGWPAGLQLTALSMRGCNDLESFIRDFTSSDRFILDYLLEEVFERQPPEVQDFLLRTCILNRLSASLCEAVTGRSGSSEMLRSLEQSNLFIVALDPSHHWYRYHHLFAEILLHRLRLSGLPVAELHQRASRWHESGGFFQDAVEHSIQAQDWGDTARLIGEASDGMFKRGEVATLLGWFRKIPQEVILSNPILCLANAWGALMTSQFEIAAPLLEHAEQAAEPGSYYLGQVASAQAFLARAKWDRARAIEKSEQALTLLPEGDIINRGNIAMNLGLACWHEGRMIEAELALTQACDLCSRSANIFALLTAQIFLARITAVRGKLRQAASSFEKLIQAGGEAPIICLAHFDLATLYHEWNDLPKAQGYLERGLALSQHSGNLEFQQSGCLLRAILAHARGDSAGADAALAEADKLARDFPAGVRSRVASFGVQLALARGDEQMLSDWQVKVHADVDAHSLYRFMGLTRPRLYLAQGEKDQASRVLKALSETASQAGWGYGMLAVRILQSMAAKTEEEAVEYIADALRLGQPEGLLRSFVDAGRRIIPLLQEAARRGVTPEYVGAILTAFGGERGQATLVEALSEREIEVLRLVTAGLSNREIASKLFISPGTAKTHIHHLCGKLAVRNRTEAAMRAKQLGLV